MFAPNHHPAMKHAAPVRKELGVRTIFNILGPLTNPAGAPNQVWACSIPDLVGIQVRVLQRLGSQHVIVVHGRDGMDEISLGAATMVGELKHGEIREYEIHPEEFGLSMMSQSRPQGRRTRRNRRRWCSRRWPTRRHAARHRGAQRRRPRCMRPASRASIADGVARAREAIASGAARASSTSSSRSRKSSALRSA